MTMNADDIKAIVYYRKQKAHQTLQEAEEMIQSAHWNLAIQRLYYAAFYMASALLIKIELQLKHIMEWLLNLVCILFQPDY